MFCFLLNWCKNSIFFKIAVWQSVSMKRNYRGFTFIKKGKTLLEEFTLNLISSKYLELSRPLLDFFSAISQETKSSGSFTRLMKIWTLRPGFSCMKKAKHCRRNLPWTWYQSSMWNWVGLCWIFSLLFHKKQDRLVL